MTAADQFVQAVRSRGSDANDVRDAAHEAAHALRYGLRSRWTRDNVHNAVVETVKYRLDSSRFFRRELVFAHYELEARAVEMLTCEHFGVPYDQRHWALMAWMETLRTLHIDMGTIENIVIHVEHISTNLSAKMLFKRVINIKELKR